MIERLLNGRADEGLWIRPSNEVRVECPKPTKLNRDVRVPMSIAEVRKIQLDCRRNLKKGGR